MQREAPAMQSRSMESTIRVAVEVDPDYLVYCLLEWRVATFGLKFSVDRASNNVEGYRGMIAGLRAVSIMAHDPDDTILMLGDARFIIKQVEGDNRC